MSFHALVIGTGYLGLPTARTWLQAGGKVTVTTRRPDRAAELAAQGFSAQLWNVLEGEGTLPEADVVLYAVGHDRTQGVPMHDIYVAGLERTLAVLPNPGHLFYISSTGVFGDTGGAWVDEQTAPNPVDEGGTICLAAEQTLQAIAEQRGFAATVFRLAGIYGPNRMIARRMLEAGQPIPGDPDGVLNLIHVLDAAAILDAARTTDRLAPLYCVSDGHPVPRREFYTEMARLLGTAPPTFDPEANRRQRGNRRVANAKLRADLKINLTYADFRDGLRQSLAEG